LHEIAARIVDDHGVRHPVVAKLPGGAIGRSRGGLTTSSGAYSLCPVAKADTPPRTGGAVAFAFNRLNCLTLTSTFSRPFTEAVLGNRGPRARHLTPKKLTTRSLPVFALRRQEGTKTSSPASFFKEAS
jgi:hypothetical protein